MNRHWHTICQKFFQQKQATDTTLIHIISLAAVGFNKSTNQIIIIIIIIKNECHSNILVDRLEGCGISQLIFGQFVNLLTKQSLSLHLL